LDGAREGVQVADLGIAEVGRVPAFLGRRCLALLGPRWYGPNEQADQQQIELAHCFLRGGPTRFAREWRRLAGDLHTIISRFSTGGNRRKDWENGKLGKKGKTAREGSK